jgi:hypothetical protein
MPDMMNERRRDKRLDECHETSISVVSPEYIFSGDLLFLNYCDDISNFGARIHANGFLPVDAWLRMTITFENMQQMLTTMAKVKWTRVISRDGSCEAGVQFSPPDEMTWMHVMPILYLYSEAMKKMFM